MSSNDEISTSLYLPFWREKSHWKVHWNVMVFVMVIVIVIVMVMVMAMDRKNQRRCRIWNPSSKLFRRQKVGMIERTLSRIIGLSIYFIPSSLRQHSVIPSSLRPFILSSLHPLIPSSLIGWVSCDYFIVEISHYHNHSFTICTPHSVYPNYIGKFLEVHGFPRTVPMWTCSIRVFNSLQYHIFNIF